MRIHTLPPRLMCPVIARLADSIWRLSIQVASRACRPYSPNDTWLPRSACPPRAPRCGLRYFVLLGINIAITPTGWLLRSRRRTPSLLYFLHEPGELDARRDPDAGHAHRHVLHLHLHLRLH